MAAKKKPVPKKVAVKAKPTKTVKKASPPEPTYEFRVTRSELEHLRDLFSVLLPPDGQASVSQFLAAVTGRQELENELFGKLEELCDKAEILTGDLAPDYVVMPISPPPMGVFLAHLEDDGEDEDSKDGSDGEG